MKQDLLRIAEELDRMPIGGASWEVAEQISAVNGILRLAEMVHGRSRQETLSRFKWNR